MSNPARLPPAPDMPPAGTKLNPVSKQVDKNGCWRLLSDEGAYVLKPVCDRVARPVTELPPCEEMWVNACRWGHPSYEQTHPTEYNALKGRFLAGEFPQMDGTLPPLAVLKTHWPSFLQQLGNLELWKQVADDEMREHWLVPDRDRNPASGLLRLAQETPDKRRTLEPTVTHTELKGIRYAAIFVAGDKHIVYLSEFVRDSLTVEEMPHTPGHEKRQGQMRAENMAFATKMEKIIEKKANLVTKEASLEKAKAQNRKEDGRLDRQRARQPVNIEDMLSDPRAQVTRRNKKTGMTATKPFTKTYLRKLCKRCKPPVNFPPKTRGQWERIFQRREHLQRLKKERGKRRFAKPEFQSDWPD